MSPIRLKPHPSMMRRTRVAAFRECFPPLPLASSQVWKSAACSASGRWRCSSKGSLMPARPSSAFFSRAASNCCAATLFEDSGTGLGRPGTRPYHLPDLRLTFSAPGVPAFTLRDFTKRAPGASLAQGWPSASIQVSYSHHCVTVILNRVAMVSSLFLVESRAGQVQPQVGAQFHHRGQLKGAFLAEEAGQLGLV